MHRYQQRLCTFSDDIQGTGAVTSATLMAAMAMIGEKVSEQRVVFFGAGTAAVGIAELRSIATKTLYLVCIRNY